MLRARSSYAAKDRLMSVRTLSLRDLFWLILVIACGCGWALDRTSLRVSRDAARFDAAALARCLPCFHSQWPFDDLRRLEGVQRKYAQYLPAGPENGPGLPINPYEPI